MQKTIEKITHNTMVSPDQCASNFTTMRKRETREIWDKMSDPMEIERKNVL